MNPRPPFMNGLLTARGILLSLKERKISEQKDKSKKNRDENNDQNIGNIPQNDKNIVPEPSQPLPPQPNPSKRQQLCQKINQIGQELHEINQENETYELIFHQLAEYYHQNHRIVEDSQRFKRRGFQLEERIKDFKERIKANYDKIEACERQGSQMQTALQECLQEFLRNERERTLVEPHKIQALKAANILRGMQPHPTSKESLERQQRDDNSSTITLNWRNLSQKTAKKAVLRKPKGDDMRESTLFTSQLYNI